MAEFIGHPMVQALAWTLVHFLWQGAGIAIVALALMSASRVPWTRYAIGAGALAAMLVAPVVTLFVQLSVSIVADAQASLASALVSAAPGTIAGVTAGGNGVAPAAIPNSILAAIVGVWLAGVGVFGLRLAGGWVVARRVARQAVRPAAAEIQRVAMAVAERLGVRRAVTVLESSLVAVPVLVGWLKPVIVLPTAALAGLTPDQLESLLAHELAHVRRHDFLVNLLQSVVEALLFYHPAVWWLSRRVRMERERCCDDLAVGVCDRLVYAEALKEMAAMSSPRLALAATDGDLVSRIRRVLGQPDDRSTRAARWIPVVVVAATIALAVQASFVIAAPVKSDQVQPKEVAIEVAPDGPVTAMAVAEIPQEVAPEQSQTAQSQVQAEQARRMAEYEALLREYDVLLRRQRSETDVERMRELRKRGLATESQVEEVIARSRQVERERAQGASAEDIVKQQIEQARRELERARALFERGLVSQSQMADAEAKLKALSQHMGQEAQTHQEVARKLLEEAARQQREHPAADIERMKREIDDHLKMTLQERAGEIEKLKRAMEDHVKATMQEREKMKHVLDEQIQASMHERERANRDVTASLRDTEAAIARLKSAEPRARVDGPAAAGDLLEVRIGGEPDLPTHYEIRPDGTIRVPFLGSFKVVGQTAAQVQAAIGKQMADRKLGAANQVTVSVLRGK